MPWPVHIIFCFSSQKNTWSLTWMEMEILVRKWWIRGMWSSGRGRSSLLQCSFRAGRPKEVREWEMETDVRRERHNESPSLLTPLLTSSRYHVPEANAGETWGSQDPPGAKKAHQGGVRWLWRDFQLLWLSQDDAGQEICHFENVRPAFLTTPLLAPASRSSHDPAFTTVLSEQSCLCPCP